MIDERRVRVAGYTFAVRLMDDGGTSRTVVLRGRHTLCNVPTRVVRSISLADLDTGLDLAGLGLHRATISLLCVPRTAILRCSVHLAHPGLTPVTGPLPVVEPASNPRW